MACFSSGISIKNVVLVTLQYLETDLTATSSLTNFQVVNLSNHSFCSIVIGIYVAIFITTSNSTLYTHLRPYTSFADRNRNVRPNAYRNSFRPTRLRRSVYLASFVHRLAVAMAIRSEEHTSELQSH